MRFDLSLLLAAVFAASPLIAQQGRWQGAIAIPDQPLDIVVELLETDSGWVGEIDIPAQGAKDVRLSHLAIDQSQVRFSMAGVPGEPRFEGELDGDAISGTFKQGAAQFPFQLAKQGDATEADFREQVPAPAIEGVPGDGFGGIWLGALEIGVSRLRLLVRLEKGEDGKWAGTIDSIDQGANGLVINEVMIDERAIKFRLKLPRAAFEGRLNEDGSALEGVWKQSGGEAPLVLYRQEKEPDFARSQEPRPPYPYQTEEVVFHNEDAGVRLAGTLTRPEGEGPFPALVFLTGSGAQDRNESLAGHKPFLVLAAHLTRAGFVTLRFDDRGVGGSTGSTPQTTTLEYAGDGLAAIEFLREQERIADHKIGLLGHSEGASAATLAASRSSEVAFVVALAHAGLVGQDLMALQARRIAAVEPSGRAAALDADRRLQQRIFQIIQQEPADDDAREKIEQLLQQEEEKRGPAAADRLAVMRELIAKQFLNPWFRYILQYDPVAPVAELDVPALFLFGELDLQVPPAENVPPLEAAAKQELASFVTLPKLNHLFQQASTGHPREYGQIEQTFAPEALDAVVSWLGERLPQQ